MYFKGEFSKEKKGMGRINQINAVIRNSRNKYCPKKNNAQPNILKKTLSEENLFRFYTTFIAPFCVN